MFFHLNVADDRPIYSQIADRITFAIAAGLLRPGELVPSVRELSKQVVVNPNTVSRAYRELQAKQILEPVRGTGLQVAEGSPERCQSERRELVRRRLRATIDEARRSELDPGEIESILREEWVKSNGMANSDGPEEGERS